MGEHINREIAEKSDFAFELRLIRSDGATRVVEARGRVEFDRADVVVGIFGVFMDVTDRVTQQRELERKRGKLEQFVNVASHDLREPLRMVSSYIEIIQQRYGDAFDERGKRFLGYVLDGAKRMKTLVDDVLEFSRSTL